MLPRIVLGVSVLLLTVNACDDDVVFDEDDGGSGAVTLETVCDTIAPRLCASRELCCDEVGIGYDEATCIERARADCEDNVDAVDEGLLAFDASTVNACLSYVDDISTECRRELTDTFGLLDELLDLCGTIFRGDKEEGDPCTLDAECAIPENGSAGCSEESNLCEQLRVRDEGQSCSFADADYCGDGLYCEMEMGMMEGTCAPALGVGESCNPIMDAAKCGLGFYCDAATMQCAEAKSEGASCTFALECRSFDCDGGACAPVAPSVDEEQCGQ